MIKSSSRSIQFFLFSATFLKPHLYLVAHQLSMRSLSKEAVLKTYLGKWSGLKNLGPLYTRTCVA